VSPAPLFRAPLLRGTVVCATMNAASLFAWWGLFTWVPRFLSLPVAQGGRGLSVVATSSWTIVMQVGTFLGYICFGYIAAWMGAKRAYIGFLLAAAAAVPLYAAVSARWLLVVGPVVGFFGTGYFSGFSVITSELFPTRLRATAMGFVYNAGRVVAAAAPYAIGRASEHAGLGAALCITSVGFAVAAVIALGLPREQRSPAAIAEAMEV
jgi:MFS family permease